MKFLGSSMQGSGRAVKYKKQESQNIIMLTLKNGKVMVFPKRIIAQADSKIQKIIADLAA